MALTEETVQDKIEIIAWGTAGLLVLTANSGTPRS